MTTEYQIPNTAHADVKPGESEFKPVPINRMVPRSFLTSCVTPSEWCSAQPLLTQSQWLGEIRKMRVFWGSLLPPDQDAALARYLADIDGPSNGK